MVFQVFFFGYHIMFWNEGDVCLLENFWLLKKLGVKGHRIEIEIYKYCLPGTLTFFVKKVAA